MNIRDLSNLRPIENCRILSQNREKILKKPGGYYLCNHLFRDPLNLEISCQGYETQVIEIKMDQVPKYVNILMRPSHMDLNDMCIAVKDSKGSPLLVIKESGIHSVETYEAKDETLLVQCENQLLPLGMAVEIKGKWQPIPIVNVVKEAAYYRMTLHPTLGFDIPRLTSIHYIAEEVG
jgi:hypothetical protein